MSLDIIDAPTTDQPEWAPLSLQPIATAEYYSSVAEYLKTIKAFQRRVTDFFKPHKDRALAAHRALCADEAKALGPAQADEATCKRLMVTWDNEQERLRREEERRRQEVARQEEETRRLNEAAALEAESLATGDSSLLDDAMAMLDSPVSVITAPVEKTTPKVVGVSYRETWRFKIVNEAKVPREYLKVDEMKIGGIVRAMKGSTTIPGVEVYCEKTVAAGSR